MKEKVTLSIPMSVVFQFFGCFMGSAIGQIIYHLFLK